MRHRGAWSFGRPMLAVGSHGVDLMPDNVFDDDNDADGVND